MSPANSIFDAWQRLLQQQLDGGTEAVVVAGSTGEAAALLDAEFDLLLRSAVEFVAGRIPVLAGTGLSNTAKTIEQTRRAAALGADAALIVTPPYVRPTQAGLVAHYRAIADDGALPVVLYNVPGRTGGDLLPETVAELCGHPRIIGIKEARAEAERMDALLRLKSEDFAVLSGDDPTACRAMLAGADGVISVASNVLPAVDAPPVRSRPCRPGRCGGRTGCAPAAVVRLPRRRIQSDSGQGPAGLAGHWPRAAPAVAAVVHRACRCGCVPSGHGRARARKRLP